MKRSHGSGHIYVKWGSYYGRWRGSDGRLINKKIGKVRMRGEKDGLTRADAERGLRRLIEAEEARPAPTTDRRPPTVDEAVVALRGRLDVEGIRPSYRANLESIPCRRVLHALSLRRRVLR